MTDNTSCLLLYLSINFHQECLLYCLVIIEVFLNVKLFFITFATGNMNTKVVDRTKSFAHLR